jgi:hypothetical protein
MERINDILRALLRGALHEEPGRARALTDVTIEMGTRRFEPRLCAEFWDGHRTSQSVSPDTWFGLCEWYGGDVAALQAVLLREAQRIYPQLVREHWAQLDGQRQTWFTRLLQRLRPDMWRGRRTERQVLVIERLRRRQFLDEGRVAWERGLQLLKENLSPEQRRQYDRSGYFDVTGGASGKRYRIRQGRSMNVEQLDKKGRRVCTLCFMPEGWLVTGDVMLAQKVALETFEREALKVANTFG